MTSQSIAVDAVLGDSGSEPGLRFSDRLFAALFNHLVYPQIWEDPEVDIDALQLKDAQDWMDDQQLNALWAEIHRTASQRARVIFRTAGEANILYGRVDAAVLGQWTYQKEQSEALHLQDRSAIYGGFHLMQRSPA